MIYTLTIDSLSGAYWNHDCIRVIEIDEQATLGELNDAIQQAVGFDHDHLYAFYAGRHEGNRKVIFGDADRWEEREANYYKLPLNKVYPLPTGLKLYYLFDYGDQWIFQIKKSRKIKEPEAGVSYPRVIESQGDNPEQYPSYEDE
jgi:Plasmid pRiA4b ORF-3-like protein